ncbi:MAG TPA: hypothetical protein VEN81_04690 [Planctomycetota bacterium]|nr:hypothetical protein [Planctomycetota bacterium]
MKKVMKSFLRVLALSLPLAGGAAADELVLKNGAALSGVVREEGDKVVLVLDFGTMTFPRSEVRSIRKTEDPLTELVEKLRTAKDAKGYFEVALWAREKGLDTRANDILRKVIALDPDHEGARKALGFQKIDGRWLEGDELMMARGFLKVNGRWLPKDTVERMQQNDKELMIENERRQTAERIAELQHDLESARLQIERERQDVDRWGWTGGLWGGSFSPWFQNRSWFVLQPPAQPTVQPPPFILGPTSFPAGALRNGASRP